MSRIALLPSAYVPTLGGVQELTRHLALALRAAGDEVEVWTQQADDVGRATTEWRDGLMVRRFPFPLPRMHPSSLLPFTRGAVATVRELRRAVGDFRPDVLHIQCFGPNGAYATALSRLTGVPLVLTLQGETVMDDHDAFDVSTSLRTALRVGLRRAAEVTACSRFTLQDSEARFGLRPGRGRVIFNGVQLVDDPADHSAPDDLVPDKGAAASGGPRAPSGRYVLALGRVVEKKGFDLLIQAFAPIAARHPDVELAIGGNGPAEASLHTLTHSLGVADQVRFLGRLSRSEVAAVMAGAAVFVMPSRLEPFGIVVLEAWRAGRATVVTSRGGPPEFVDDGVNGLLVDPFDTPRLTQALDRILDDAAYGRSLGEAARRRVTDFDWPAIAEQYRRLYREVCDPTTPRSRPMPRDGEEATTSER